jgi:hypothetical protein
VQVHFYCIGLGFNYLVVLDHWQLHQGELGDELPGLHIYDDLQHDGYGPKWHEGNTNEMGENDHKYWILINRHSPCKFHLYS